MTKSVRRTLKLQNNPQQLHSEISSESYNIFIYKQKTKNCKKEETRFFNKFKAG